MPVVKPDEEPDKRPLALKPVAGIVPCSLPLVCGWISRFVETVSGATAVDANSYRRLVQARGIATYVKEGGESQKQALRP